MSLITFSVKHNRTPDDARDRLVAAVEEARHRYGPMIRRVDWSPDRSSVTITSVGAVAEMRVDVEHVHASVDVPALGGLLGGRLARGLKDIVQKRLT